MTRHIYVENAVADHPTALGILERFPHATVVPCDRYTEVFNPRSQNFRLQKRRPATILARKHDGLVLEAPEGYRIGEGPGYYFSHMLNCVYDCRYCFLQGMYRSAHQVVFVNYEDFTRELSATISRHRGQPVWFFSGYDCDSLAWEPVTRFVANFLPFLERHPSAHLEIRTKSTQVRSLLCCRPLENVVVAFSLSPGKVAASLEHRTPSPEARIDAMARVQAAGWPTGLRLDPLILHDGYRAGYRALLKALFARVDARTLHSVSLGPFRLPRTYFRNLRSLYPDEPLFAGPLVERGGMVSYGEDAETAMRRVCLEELAQYVPEERIFPCTWGG